MLVSSSAAPSGTSKSPGGYARPSTGGRVKSAGSGGRLTPMPDYMRPVTKSQPQQWKKLHEDHMMAKLVERRNDKKERNQKLRSEAAKIARKVPMDILTKEWMKEHAETAETRLFLVDKILPTLILGLEKLLTEADQKGLAEKEDADANFNPVNFLAQYLMRNNPRYSNFSEASPYIRGLREVGEHLKEQLFDMEDNRLVRIKLEARKKREERERMEKEIQAEKRRREGAITAQYYEWTVPGSHPDGRMDLALIQNALRSFVERTEDFPEPVSDSRHYQQEVAVTDDTGKMLQNKDFITFVRPMTEELSREMFDALILHMSRCAKMYRAQAERAHRKSLLTTLFVSCDHTGVGQLDRHRILNLYEMFYDRSGDDLKDSLRNPRKWPVVQLSEEQLSDDEGEDDATRDDDNADKPAQKPATPQKAPLTSGEDRPPRTQQSRVSFKEGTSFEREKTLLTSHGTRSQSQASAFDENLLNASQFVHLTETFLGDEPTLDTFNFLVRYIKEGYMETEDERMARLLQARLEAREAKRKALLNSLFEMWDNDGSGMVELEEVEAVMRKYKDGLEEDAVNTAKADYKSRSRHHDNRLSKREFRSFFHRVVANMTGGEDGSFDFFIEYLISSVERSYQERVRGEARKKWLQQIITAAETSGANMEPVYKTVFQSLYKDAESHGGGKKINAYIAMLETNHVAPPRGPLMLRYSAATPGDADCLLGKALFRDMKGISFAAVESGKPIHVPRVQNHGNIHFWNPERGTDRDGSFIVVPLKDRKKRVFGLLGLDTLDDAQTRAIFITHEIQFFQGIAKAFSIAYHHVDVRQKTMRISESAVSWIQRRCGTVHDITIYMVEPEPKSMDFLLRKMVVTDRKGNATLLKNPARLERKDNLFRDYLFKCVDNSESVTADAYGERHLAFPLRDHEGRAIVVVDISIGADHKTLPKTETKEVMKMLRLLQLAYKEISKESKEGGDDGPPQGQEADIKPDIKPDEASRTEILFDRLMLLELRDNVAKLDAKAYAELKSYKEPPPVIHSILKALLGVFYHDKAKAGEFNDWAKCKTYVNPGLSTKILTYDPTDGVDYDIPVEIINAYLDEVPHGEVSKHGSIPAEYLYNWVFVCVSLVEHTRKMAANKQMDLVEQEQAAEPPAAEQRPAEPAGAEQAPQREASQADTQREDSTAAADGETDS